MTDCGDFSIALLKACGVDNTDNILEATIEIKPKYWPQLTIRRHIGWNSPDEVIEQFKVHPMDVTPIEQEDE